MNILKDLRDSGFKLIKSLSISPEIGLITDSLGLHTGLVGRPRSVITRDSPIATQEHGFKDWLVYKTENIHRDPPNTFEKEIPEPFLNSESCKGSDYLLYHLDKAYVLRSDGFVLTKDRNFLLESASEPNRINLDYDRIKNRVLWPKLERVHGKLVMAYNRYSINNYYHWMLEFLPKISLLEKSQNGMPNDLFFDAKILLPPNPRSWMLKSLQMLGIDENQVYHPTSNHLKVDQLLFMPPFATKYCTPSWAYQWYKDRFSAFIEKSEKKTKRIYISRQNAQNRQMINEAQVINFLSKYGFETYLLEEMTLPEQISLFSQAEIIVGPHGAGFSNMIFSTRATLIDIFEPTYIHPCFYNMCSDTGQFYWFVMGDTIQGKDIMVDIGKLKKTLDLALSQREMVASSG